MRRGSAVVIPPGPGVLALYDVVLLAGRPRRLSLRLEPGIAREDVVEVDGERWEVADVRDPGTGTVQLICIHASS